MFLNISLINRMKIAAVITLIVMLARCDFGNNQLKTYMKCGIVAHQLGETNAENKISQSLKEYLRKNKTAASMNDADISRLSQEVRDDLNLEGQTISSGVETLINVYNSSECRKLHGQEKIPT